MIGGGDRGRWPLLPTDFRNADVGGERGFAAAAADFRALNNGSRPKSVVVPRKK